ncbi:hypothetical protein N8I77_010155 [Diaporthe amygdali]|uniref:Erythromycin biosynthesis protein CIII-like C-terminal domain-containing protein n=1 Tax=Phomopsis amygdali TaxID=1214568 RepID=A0AAD9S6E2_PHOAM|nr:hypothetical protein N8I77_010155 [Diaporthe amygdali]
MENLEDQGKKPAILAIAGAAVGHFMPVLHITQHLISRGFDVTILQASYFKPQIEAIGAHFLALEKECDWCQYDLALAGSPEGKFPERLQLEPGLETLAYDLEHIFMPYIPAQARSIRKAVDHIRERTGRTGAHEVVILAENSILGILPLRLVSDAKIAESKVPPVLGLNVVPLTFESVDVGPFGTGLPPDSTPSGRTRNQMLHGLIRNFVLKNALKAMRRYMIEAGAEEEWVPKPGTEYMGFNITYHPRVYDKVLQMCGPQVEFPRSDLPSHIQFAGGLGRKAIPKDYQYPEWWQDIIANASLSPDDPRKKSIIVVSQGTFANNFNDLILPTVAGMKDQNNILTVAILGKKGAVLKLGQHGLTELPSNARVADFLLYDAILPYADVWVQNGGYGGFQHGIANAVPTVLAGVTEDKPEIAARATWAGVGISLGTGSPTPEQVLKGVNEVLGNEKYKLRCEELSKAMAEYDPLGRIEKELLALANK